MESTTLLHVDRSEAELTQLRSLEDVKRAREDRYRIRKSRAEAAKKPKTPLAVKVNAVIHPKVKASVPMDTLEHCDSLYSTIERLAIACPLDAVHLARALLKTLLRLAWVRASGKSNTNPDPTEVPHKLFNRKLITLAAMRRIDKAVKRDTSTTSNLLECCRCLLVWLSSEPGAVMSALEDEPSEPQKAVAPVVSAQAQTAIAAAGIIPEADVINVLGVDWETWERDYRNRIPGRTTEKGRFYLRSDLQDWFAKHSASSKIQTVQSAGGVL